LPLKSQVHELPFSRYFDQPGRLKFLDMVGQGRRPDAMDLVDSGTSGGVLAGPNLLKDLKSTGFGQRTSDPLELQIG